MTFRYADLASRGDDEDFLPAVFYSVVTQSAQMAANRNVSAKSVISRAVNTVRGAKENRWHFVMIIDLITEG